MKIIFDKNRIRIRLTYTEFTNLQQEKSCVFALSIEKNIGLKINIELDKNQTKPPYFCQLKNGALNLILHPTMLNEIVENPKDGLSFQQNTTQINLAVDLRKP